MTAREEQAIVHIVSALPTNSFVFDLFAHIRVFLHQRNNLMFFTLIYHFRCLGVYLILMEILLGLRVYPADVGDGGPNFDDCPIFNGSFY